MKGQIPGNYDQHPRFVAHGHTMEPTIRPGDHVVVDTEVTGIAAEGIYAIGFKNGRHYVTFARAKPVRGGVKLTFDNKDYKPEVLRGHALRDLRVYGRALMVGRTL